MPERMTHGSLGQSSIGDACLLQAGHNFHGCQNSSEPWANILKIYQFWYIRMYKNVMTAVDTI